MAPLFVTDEALAVPHVFCSFFWREINPVNIHGVGISGWLGSSSWLSWWNEAVSSTSELSESYHVLVELSCLIKPLFPFPASLFLSLREGSGSHHDSKLVGYPSLEGIYQYAVEVNSTVCLGQSKGSGILVKVTVELVHA